MNPFLYTGRFQAKIKYLFLILIFFLSRSFCQDTLKTAVDSAYVNGKNINDSVFIYDSHVQDLMPGNGFYIRSSDGRSYVKIYGSVKLNGGYDIGGLKTKQTFSTFDIPTGTKDNEGRFFMSPYQSRFGFEVKLITGFGPVNMKLESDFQGTGNSLRIRHAFGVLGNFLLGQTWSVFGDPSSIPKTVDLDGPNSSLGERTIQARFEPKESLINWSIAFESPKPDITNPDSLDLEPVFQSFPDITARVKLTNKAGYIRLAGIFRSITVRNIDNSTKILAGYGGLISGRLNLNKNLLVNFQLTAGKGISRYIVGLTGKGQDVLFNPLQKENNLLPVFGGFLSFSKQWNKKFSSDITFGILRVFNLDFQTGDSFRESYYASANIYVDVIDGNGMAVEYSVGKRINKDKSYGYANRISFIGFMNF